MQPDERRIGLLEAGLRAAKLYGFFLMTSEQVAAEAQVTRTLINNYFNNMRQFRGELVKHAVKTSDLEVIAMLVTGRDAGLAGMVPTSLRVEALQSLR
jgi:DNA-binding transcriptional regulator YbjK